MPIYATKCRHCGTKADVYLPVSQYKNLPQCCGEMVERVITAPYIAPDIQPYRSMITGEEIGSRSQHRAHLKAHGMVEVGNEKFDSKPKKAESLDVPGLREELYARISG